MEVTRLREWLHLHVSVRAEGMILAAGIWCLVGLRPIIGAPMAPTPELIHTLAPAPLRSAVWLIAALVAATTATLRKASGVGLGLLAVPPIITVCSYLWSWLMSWPGSPGQGRPDDWYGAAIYLVMLLWVVHLSRIPADVRAPLSGRRAL